MTPHAPIPEPQSVINESPSAVRHYPPTIRHIAAWRWLIAMLVIGSYPLLSTAPYLFGDRLAHREGPALPDNVPQLLLFCGLQLLIFAVFWVLAWAFARPTQEHLGWKWDGKFQPIGLGVAYFLALRIAPAFLLMGVVILALAAGVSMEDLQKQVMANRPNPEAMVDVKVLTSSPLYMLLLTTFVSFVVAGLREELWRAFTMSALMKLLPGSMTLRAQQVIAVVATSVIFGIGHITQGPIAMVLTGVIGLLLGAAIQIHRSIWPAVIAHGLFDATSFLLLPVAAQLQKSGLGTKLMVVFGG